MSQILVLALIFYRVMRHVSTLQMRYQIVITGEGAFSKLMDEIEEGEAAREELRKDGPRIQLTRGVRVDRVSFSYGNTRILNDIELDIPAGSFVVLAGESGSGKTTLADLVAGLRPPGAGTILIDGRPLSEIDMGAWRRSIGYVPQELLLFNDTIERNVTLGDPSITEEDVERALRLAEAWPFVSSREKGLQHPVGERGIELSGGQRQRIAIARALVTRPTLLILDEVTTALDPDTEREICRTLRELAGEVTILTISHQPAIREVADVVYEMRNGQLHELRHPVST
jgi:ATP-binding cassette subfamily C protein